MDILYLLIPMSVVLVFIIIGVFAWAMRSGQFDDIEREGLRILDENEKTLSATSSPPVDADQASAASGHK